MTRATPLLTILQVTPALHEGGVEQSTLEMSSFIKKQGARALVASAGGAGEAVLKRLGVAHFKLPLDRKTPWAMMWNMLHLRRIIRENAVDIVHVRSRAPAWCAWLVLRLGNFSRVKFITTYHGTYGHQGFFKRLYNGVMLKGPVIIANSDFIRRHLMEVYGVSSDRIVVAARGVEPERYDPAAWKDSSLKKVRAELKVPDGVPLLLMTGRLTHWKGQHVLLDALAKVKTKRWVAAFAGGATQPAYAAGLQAQAFTLGIGERVRWLGNRKDIPLLNKAADVAFSCSVRPEAFGRVSIEAQAMGTPVIASALGGSLETVKDGVTGWLVPPDDATALAKAIDTALENPKRLATMGKAARAWVMANFTTETCCAAEWFAYQRLVGKKPQGRKQS
jgi:glycosyltransferase involved in cell wall biosynthesis